jgi:hypothetical protein
MSSRTRYFLIGSALVVVVGLCTGLVAYYNGSAAGAARLPELVYVPADASAVAYADVQHIMTSEFRQKLRAVLPTGQDKDQLMAETGIDIEHDIDTVVAGMGGAKADPHGALVLFRGRFDTGKIEALAQQHGAVVQEYNGKRMLLHPLSTGGPAATPPENLTPGIAFLEPGLLALGSREALQRAIDSPSQSEGVTSNAEMMTFVTSAQQSGNAWIVGRFDALADQPLPPQVRQQLPSLDWFMVSANVDRDVQGTIRAEARDEQAGEQLRNIVTGGLAALRMFSGHDARFDAALNSLQASGTGKTVELTFTVSPEVLDALKGSAPAGMWPTPPAPPAPPAPPVPPAQ